MSNIYHLEPPTKGKLVIHTSFGPIDVELWAREAPLACRNFVQLALEGYYDNTLFHRVIKSFMVQGGDPTGLGTGGTSIYTQEKDGYFRDEIHSRLKFTHRGILAMANENKPHTNGSQFFFTLDACEHLQGKHTIFGKVTGDTVFNLMRMGETPTDLSDRPTSPLKLTHIEILANPFDDIVPRDLSKIMPELHIQKGGAGGGGGEGGEEERKRKEKERKREERLKRAAKKDLKLLSFGDDEEGEEGEDTHTHTHTKEKKKKRVGVMSVHDVDPSLRKEVDEEVEKDTHTHTHTDNGKGKGKEGREKATHSDRETDRQTDTHTHTQEGGINLAGADDEAAAFAARMRAKMSKHTHKHTHTHKRKLSEKEEEGEEEGLGEEGEDEQQRQIREKANEYKKLKEEMKKSERAQRAVAVDTGDAAKKRREEKGYHEMLTPLEIRRQKYLEQKRKGGGDREEATLAKLSSFSSSLFTKRKQAPASQNTHTHTHTQESYHGQITQQRDILDGGDEEETDEDWCVGGLKFKKHVDDKFRGGDGRGIDDYVTVVPSGKGKGQGQGKGGGKW